MMPILTVFCALAEPMPNAAKIAAAISALRMHFLPESALVFCPTVGIPRAHVNLPDCGSLTREPQVQPADWLQRIGELGLVRLDERRWGDRAGDDHITGAELLPVCHERAGHMLHNADHLTDQGFDVVLLGHKGTAAENVTRQPIELRARTRGIG